MSAMAASLGVDSKFIRVEAIRVDRLWHRRVKLGAFDWWRPDGCARLITSDIEEARDSLPRTESVCRVCFPVWPPIRGKR